MFRFDQNNPPRRVVVVVFGEDVEVSTDLGELGIPVLDRQFAVCIISTQDATRLRVVLISKSQY